MGKNRGQSRQKSVNPTFWIFCEGETEKSYVDKIKPKDVLVEIITKVAKQRINQQLINGFKRGKAVHKKDKNILIYDGDIKTVIDRINKIPNTKKIISTPEIELWFLLHFQEQTANISNKDCERELKKHNPNYEKGRISASFSETLFENKNEAIKRAKKLKILNNPSSNMYEFIELLEKSKLCK